MTSVDCNDKMILKNDPVIDVVINSEKNKFTLALYNWDVLKNTDGYTREEAEDLISMLETGIKHLNEYQQSYSHELLFKENEIEREQNKIKL